MTITDDAPVTDPDAVDHTAALKKAGAAYARKQRAADTAREALVIVIRNAGAAGMTKTAISDAADVARETVYKALRGATPTAGTVDIPEGGVPADGGAIEVGDRLVSTP